MKATLCMQTFLFLLVISPYVGTALENQNIHSPSTEEQDQNPGPMLSCPKEWTDINGECLRIISKANSLEDVCGSVGGQLAVCRFGIFSGLCSFKDFAVCKVDKKVTCLWSEWSPFGQCDQETGKQIYERMEIDPEAKDDGSQCSGNSLEIRDCKAPCVWSEWSSFGECDEYTGK